MLGILCKINKSGVQFWLNIYQQNYKEVVTNRIIYQYNFILSPIFVFCSYLPYELDIELNIDQTNSSIKHSISSNSLYYGGKDIGSGKKLSVNLRHTSRINNKKAEPTYEFNSHHWFERPVVLLDQTNANVSECLTKSDNSLKLANLYQYKYFESGAHIKPDESDFDIKIDSVKLAAVKQEEELLGKSAAIQVT